LCTVAFPAEEGKTSLAARISWIPENPKQGDVVLLSLALPEGVRLREGSFRSKPILFFPNPEQAGALHAILGVDASREPGNYEVKITIESASHPKGAVQIVEMVVHPGNFKEERLTLPDSMVNLSKESLERVRKDQRSISSLWPKATGERLWEGAFLIPVEGKPGSPFGLRRWINNEPRNFHTGMDFKAPEKTPVLASNKGRVALVGDFFFSGNSVFLDHGQGLYTMYFHLSGIKVKTDEIVQKGEVIGWVGMTGRATGPHLHWGVRLGGERVDPVALIRRTEFFSMDPHVHEE